MKTIITYIFMFICLSFLACEYKDEDKKKDCQEAYMLKLVTCRSLPTEEQSNCFFDAGTVLYYCDPDSYWKSWGCEDGEPCM